MTNYFFCNHTITDRCILSVQSQDFTFIAFNAQVTVVEPVFFLEAKDNPFGEEAMQKELEALSVNGRWDIVKLPKGKKHISCRWVYKIKYIV